MRKMFNLDIKLAKRKSFAKCENTLPSLVDLDILQKPRVL